MYIYIYHRQIIENVSSQAELARAADLAATAQESGQLIYSSIICV